MGVDGARAGWIAASLWRDDRSGDERTSLDLYPDVSAVAARRERGVPVAIDIPIGLPDTGPRVCDLQARKLLGRRGSTVFPAPARWTLAFADDYAGLRAHVAARRAAGEQLMSLSAQAHGILAKVREVDSWFAHHPAADEWLLECHPELSFVALKGGHAIQAQKKSADGRAQRRSAIAAAFPDAPLQLDTAAIRWRRSQVAIDDLHDAYACLHTAIAVTRGHHQILGNSARDAHGRPMQIITATTS